MQTLTTPMIPMQTPLELCQKTYQPTWICPVPPSNDESHEDEMGGPSAAVTPLPADGGEVPREAGHSPIAAVLLAPMRTSDADAVCEDQMELPKPKTFFGRTL